MQAAIDAGGWITMSTGRGYQLVKPFLDRVPVNAPLICCNGGLIVEPLTREVLHVRPMPLSVAHDLIRLSQAEGIAMWFYLADLETMLERRADDTGFVLRRDGITLRHVPDPISELADPPHKVIVVAPSPQDIPAISGRVEQCVGERARVLSSGPHWIEVLLPDVSKAWAMDWLAAHLGVGRDETVAIGDADNDVEMLEWAGLGIAMGNASAAAKAAADWIAPSVDEDGLAVALQRFVLDASTGEA
jgi:hypothetical protein